MVQQEKDVSNDDVFKELHDNKDFQAFEGRTIYLTRHGESEFNLLGRIGGNSNLSNQGEKYAASIAEYFNRNNLPNMKVWTSELVRTHQTARDINFPKFSLSQLNEIYSGDHDGMTYEEIAEAYPVEFANRDQDKLRYRYPNGESYLDVCKRLAEILPEMNKSNNLVVVSHQAVIRCIIAYLNKSHMEELPYIKVPLHTVLKVTMVNGVNKINFIKMAVDCVDTYRAKPTNCNLDRDFKEAVESVPFHL